jgi:hypothetical protein
MHTQANRHGDFIAFENDSSYYNSFLLMKMKMLARSTSRVIDRLFLREDALTASLSLTQLILSGKERNR